MKTLYRLALLLHVVGGCDDAELLSITTDPPRVSLETVAIRPLPPRPWGMALTPDGSFLVLSNFRDDQVYVLDADSYEGIGDPLVSVEPRGIVIAPATGQTSTVFVAGESGGLTLFSLSPEGQLALIPPLDREWTSFLVRSERTGAVYATVISSEGDRLVARLGSDGTRLATHPLKASVRAGLAPTDDGELILAIEDEGNPPRLVVLDAENLSLVAEVEIPPWASQVIPLDDSRRAAIVGGESEPLLMVVDWEEDAFGPVQQPGGRPGRAGFDVGRGNTWVRIGPDLALVGTTHGLIAVDTRTGAAARVMGDFDDGTHVNECCAMVWDAQRRRLLVASSIAPADEAGRLEVYRLDGSILGP